MNQNYKEEIGKLLLKITGKAEFTDKISAFLDFLLLKNNELNLVSRKLTIEEILQDHFYDSLVGYPFFKPHASITDIGTGGGFPGIILSIIFPDKKITLIEKSPKKSNFLNEAVEHLFLKNVLIKNTLVDLCRIDSQVLTCRAFKETVEILDMTKTFFNSNGKYILYKARLDKINEELLYARKKYRIKKEIHKIESIKDKERHIVLLEKD